MGSTPSRTSAHRRLIAGSGGPSRAGERPSMSLGPASPDRARPTGRLTFHSCDSYFDSN